MPGQYSSTGQGHKSLGNEHRLEGPLETWKLNVVEYPGLNPGTE